MRQAHRVHASALVVLALPAAAVAWAWPQGVAPWRFVAIVSAWAGTGLLIASLVLMLREPLLARALGGLEHMLRWHHRAGVAGYLVLLAHPLALALDARVEDPALAAAVLDPRGQPWAVGVGWAALLAMMAGLAATFMPSLAYRPWRATHFVLGFAVAGGLVHVLELLGHAGLPWLVAALAAVVLVWRFVLLDRGWRSLAYRVTATTHPAATMIEATLAPLAAGLRAAAGQFVLARFLDAERYAACGAFHPFTVSEVAAGGRLKVAIKALGPCSAQLQQLQPGALVQLQGPFGEFLGGDEPSPDALPPQGSQRTQRPQRPQRPQLWIAGGIGITPFIAALRQGPCSVPTTLLYLVRRPEDAAFADELRAMAESQPLFTLSIQPTGDAPPALEPLLVRLADLPGRQVQVCGPPALVRALLPLLAARGVPRAQVHHEAFDFR